MSSNIFITRLEVGSECRSPHHELRDVVGNRRVKPHLTRLGKNNLKNQFVKNDNSNPELQKKVPMDQ